MKKHKIMLMFFALVLVAGTASAATWVSVDWAYNQTDATPHAGGTLSDVSVPAELVGGLVTDPDVVFTVAGGLPVPSLTQVGTIEGGTLGPGDVGFSNTLNDSDQWGNGAFTGIRILWSGTVSYTATANSKNWILPLQLILNGGGINSTNYSYDMTFRDNLVDTDVTGGWQMATWWGDNKRESGSDTNVYGTGQDSFTDTEVGTHDEDTTNGDDLGVAWGARRQRGAGPWTGNEFILEEFIIGGTLVVDLDYVYWADDPCPIIVIKDLADITGPEGVPDCVVDAYDLALMALEWLDCGATFCPPY